MANLPSNQEYNIGNKNIAPKAFSPASYSGAISAMQGYRTLPKETGYAEQLAKIQSGELNQPVGKAFDRPAVGEKYSTLPEGYAGFVNPYKPTEAITTPEGVQARNIPGVEGQYLLNQADLKTPLKSARGYTKEEKAMLLMGRPSSLYQIDHIIPIWAEGTDTLANKQVLTNEKHNDKTRAQAVTLTLLANGLINKNQARLQAMQWQNRDLTDVPMPTSDTGGMIDLNVAKDIQARWDRQQEDPGYGTVLGAPWKDVKKEIGETVNVFGKGIIPEPIRQFGKGLVSGITGGWLGGGPDASGFVGQAASLTGNILGMIMPVGLLARTLGVAGRTIAATRAGSKIIKPIDIARETKFYNAAKATEVTRWNKPSFQNELIKNVRYDFGNVVKNTGALALYGQLSKDQFEMDTRTENFWTNVGYGVMSGAVPHSIKGAVKLASGGAIMEAMIGETDPRQMTINALAIGAMHALGAKGANARIEQKMKEIEPILIAGQRSANSSLANNLLHPYLPKEFPMLKDGEDPSLITQKYTQEQLDEMAWKALNKVAEERKTLSTDDADLNELRVKTAFRFLHNERLPEGQRELAYLQDLYSLQKKANESSSFLHPETAVKAADTYTDDMMRKSFKYHQDADTPTIDPKTGQSKVYPKGTVQLTGQGKTEIDEAGALKLMEAMNRGEGYYSPRVFAVLSPEREYAIRRANLAYTKEEIASGEQRPSENPQNAMPVYAVVRDLKDGPRTVIRIGWIPRKFRIDEGKYAQNKSQWMKSAERPDGFEPNDPMLNKDTFANAVREAETDLVFFNLDKIGVAKGSQKPYVFVSSNEETWRQSIEHAKKRGDTVETSPLQQNIREVNSAIKGKDVSEHLNQIRQKVETPADMVLTSAPHADNPVLRDVTIDHIETTRTALNSETPDALFTAFRDQVGIRLTPEETQSIFARRKTMTVKDLFKVMKVAHGENRLSPVSPFIYSSIVGPYLKSPVFKSWPNSKIWLDLRITGGMRSLIEPTVQPKLPITKTAEQPILPTVEPKTSVLQGVEDVKKQAEQAISPQANALVTAYAKAPTKVQVKVEAPKEGTTAKKIEPTENKVTVRENMKTGPYSSSKATSPEAVERRGAEVDRLMNVFNIDEKLGIKPEQSKVAEVTPAIKPQEPIQQAVAPKVAETPVVAKKEPIEQNKRTLSESWRRLSLLKEGEPIMTQVFRKERKGTVNEYTSTAVADLVDRGELIIDQMRAGKKDTTTSIAQKIGEIIKKITPSGEYTPQERLEIMKEARGRLMGPAERRVKEMINPEQEIAFKMGGLPEGEVARILIKDMTDANIANSIGNRERAVALLEKHPIEDIKATAQALGLAGVDGESGILSILKKGKHKTANDSMDLVSKKTWTAYAKLKKGEGDKMIKPIKEGLKKDPNTYEHAFAFTLDKLFKNMFGANYEKDPSKIGGLLSESTGRKEFAKQYELSDPMGFGEEITHPKEFIEARAEGAKSKAAQFKVTRAKQLAEEVDINKYRDLMSTGEKALMSGEDMSGTQIKSKLQLENIGGLTNADIEMMPGVTAIAMGSNINQVRAGIEDARGFAQMIQKISNQGRANALKAGKKMKPTDKWVSFAPRGTATTKKDIVKNTDKYISEVINEYLKKFPKRTTWSPETATASEKTTLGL